MLKANLGPNGDFWSPDNWPSNSPDCNPLDYFFWGVLEREVCKTSHNSINALKASTTKEWSNVPLTDVVSACDSFRSRLVSVIKAKGGHIE